MVEISPCVYDRHWVHSREQDSEDVQVYHPDTYNFPPSRGRRGFEIKRDGRFIQYGIAPDDRQKRNEGRWFVEGTNTIGIELAAPETKRYKIKIVSCDNDTLKIQRLG
jgi:hypothetical protein